MHGGMGSGMVGWHGFEDRWQGLYFFIDLGFFDFGVFESRECDFLLENAQQIFRTAQFINIIIPSLKLVLIILNLLEGGLGFMPRHASPIKDVY